MESHAFAPQLSQRSCGSEEEASQELECIDFVKSSNWKTVGERLYDVHIRSVSKESNQSQSSYS